MTENGREIEKIANEEHLNFIFLNRQFNSKDHKSGIVSFKILERTKKCGAAVGMLPDDEETDFAGIAFNGNIGVDGHLVTPNLIIEPKENDTLTFQWDFDNDLIKGYINETL